MGRHVAGQQYGGEIRMMHPSELAPLAADRLSDPVHRAHVEDIAGRIQRQGYRAKQHDAFTLKNTTHIHVAYTDDETFVMNGNHRVAALALAGYTKKVPVRVTDLRTKP